MVRMLAAALLAAAPHLGAAQGCPVCTCDGPTVWPFSGCDVTCGAKCGDACCCIPGVGDCAVQRAKKPVPKYVVNLDLEPEQRYTELAASKKTYYNVLTVALKAMFKGDKYDQFIAAIVLPEETQRELQGLADALGVSLKTLYLGEFYYELDALSTAEERANYPPEFRGLGTRACTGIVAQASDGTVYHGRNQDYPPPFSPLQYDAEFQKGGQTLYEATNFIGIVSIGGTCMVPGGFSVEINARETEGSLANFLQDAQAGKPTVSNLVRQACARGGDFEGAVQFLSQTPALGASNYYVVAGARPGEGAVITRDASGQNTDVQRLSQGYPAENPWYLIQDNYDRWDEGTHPAPILPGVFGDDLRRKSGHELMAQLSPDDFQSETMWAVMSDDGATTLGAGHWGIYNQATIHTEIVVPGRGEYRSYQGHEVVASTLV